jgi:peptidoglycan L-alanyl-D-glutamate endopeptidase CwlK
MSYKLSQRSWDRLEGVHPVLLELLEEAMKEIPHDIGIPQFGGLRSVEDQQSLYAIGRTVETGRKPVTHTDGIKKKSNHQAHADGFGYAFDIYIYLPAERRASWDRDKLTEVALHILKVAQSMDIPLTWGGSWKWKDMPHFELREI